MPEMECARCGAPFVYTPLRTSGRRRKYCDTCRAKPERPTSCTGCGEALPPRGPRRWCSQACRERAKYLARLPTVPCSVCSEPIRSAATKRKRACSPTCSAALAETRNTFVKTCEGCSTTFTTTSRPARYCSLACFNGGRANTRSGRTCEVCGITYKASHTGQRTCGRKCGMVLQVRLRPPAPIPQPKGRSHRIFFVDCKVCGRAFVARQWKQACCSDPCGRARATERRKSSPRQPHASNYRRRVEHFGGVYVEDVDREAVFARDDWQCHLCGQHTDPTTAWPDHAAPSLDHIVPISKGGEHSYANVACAHLGCNWSKNDRYETRAA